jgi:nucleoside-diphosphate-sugar epimerase
MLTNSPVLITGATGFVGSHLANRFLSLNRPVHCIVRPNSKLERISWLCGEVKVHIYDGTTASVQRTLAEVRPRSVFHLASMTNASPGTDQIEDMILSNILLGTQLLEAASANGTESFISAGTFWQHFDSQGYSPRCLYSATKQAFEDILRYYADARGLKATVLALFDTYGPYDPRNRLFTQLRDASRTGIPLKMSAGGQMMDLVYIDDVVRAFIQAEMRLAKLAPTSLKVYGISSGKHILLRHLVAQYCQVTGFNVPVEWGAKPYREREIMVPWIPNEPLPEWSPRVCLDEGIRRMEGLSEGVAAKNEAYTSAIGTQ